LTASAVRIDIGSDGEILPDSIQNGSRWIPGWWVDSSKIEELNRQDAKITERKKRMRESSPESILRPLSSLRLLGDSWRLGGSIPRIFPGIGHHPGIHHEP
jgi:hypothetical protein